MKSSYQLKRANAVVGLLLIAGPIAAVEANIFDNTPFDGSPIDPSSWGDGPWPDEYVDK